MMQPNIGKEEAYPLAESIKNRSSVGNMIVAQDMMG